MKRTFATPKQIAEARELYQTDDIEIDDNALVSESDEPGTAGCWVQAWVWLK